MTDQLDEKGHLDAREVIRILSTQPPPLRLAPGWIGFVGGVDIGGCAGGRGGRKAKLKVELGLREQLR